MLFNSIEFLIFLPFVFIIYWLFPKLKYQNILILISSYTFYGWWDYRFLSLIFLSTIIDFIIALKIYQTNSINKRKIFLMISILFNIGLLIYFKYFNFFIQSWVNLFNNIGYEISDLKLINVVLPVGISFYTFQTMSYTIDVYRKNLVPTKNFITFASFVSFFPQLVAGPIERATNLLPQLLNKRRFETKIAIQGFRLIVWGMFKKVFIADSLAPSINEIFNNYLDYSGMTLALGGIFFAFQIYCDFSGYSDIAIGSAKLFGIELMSNFKFPYFSRNIGEFWRKWHISLSTWFRDYLYIPCGGSKINNLISIRNIFIIFLVSGFWHGANWTFILWGFFHALLFIPSFINQKNRIYISNIIAENKKFPSFLELLQIISTFCLVTIGWIIFRSNSIMDAVNYLFKIIFDFNFSLKFSSLILYIFPLIFLDWIFRKDEKLKNISEKKMIWIFDGILIILILEKFGDYNEFIYFQF